jgi:ribosomal protein L4
MARGHRVDAVPELPLVLDNLHASTETKTLLAALKAFGAGDDLEKVLRSKKVRSGKRAQAGGYHQYMSNVPYTPSYSTGGQLPASESALANPVPFKLTNNCVDNYKH